MAKRQPKPTTKTTTPVPDEPRPLTEAEEAEMVAWGERIARQQHPPRFKDDGKGALMHADGVDRDLHFARIFAAFGVADQSALNVLSCQAAETCDGDTAMKYNIAAALCAGIQPRSELEGMLAVQMVGCHNAAMTLLRRAHKTDRVDFLTKYGNLAAKFLRVFVGQTEALARLRGQTSKQVVRVEHVTVEAGAQAVVGAVATGGGPGDDDGIEQTTPCAAIAPCVRGYPMRLAEARQPARRSH